MLGVWDFLAALPTLSAVTGQVCIGMNGGMVLGGNKKKTLQRLKHQLNRQTAI